MSYFKKHIELLEYMKKPLSIESIELLYNTNNVHYENSVVYRDFSIALTNLIMNTYLGDNLTNDEDKLKHFDWCWDKTNANFNKEGIDFNLSKNLKKWYYENYEIVFYHNLEKDENLKIGDTLNKFFKDLFNIQCIKTRAEVDLFLQVYNLFNHNLFNKKTK